MSIAAMLSTANLYADVFLYVYPMEASKKARVELSLPVQSPVNIYVFDNKGKLILEENIKKGVTYRKIYDFSNLPTGRYTIVSNSEFLEVTKTILLNKNSIEVVSTTYLHRPYIKLKDNLLTVKYINLTRSDVELSLEDSQRIYYKANLPSDVVFRKTFDIQKLLRGKYWISFEADGNTFVHQFTKN